MNASSWWEFKWINAVYEDYCVEDNVVPFCSSKGAVLTFILDQ